MTWRRGSRTCGRDPDAHASWRTGACRPQGYRRVVGPCIEQQEEFGPGNCYHATAGARRLPSQKQTAN